MEYTVEANVARRKLNNSRFLSLMESGSSSEASGPESHVLKDQNRKDDFSSSTPVAAKLKKATKTPHLSPINSSASSSGSGIPIAPENAKLKGLSLRARAQLKAAGKAKAQLSESQKASIENARPDVRGNKGQKNTDTNAQKATNEVFQPKSGGSKARVVHSPILEDEEPENDNDYDEEPENDNDEDEEPENEDDDEEPENDNDEDDEEPENDNDEEAEPILTQKEPLADGKHFEGVKTIIATGPRATRSAVSKDKPDKIDSSAKVRSSPRLKLPVAVKRKEPVTGKSTTAKKPNESEKRTLDRPKVNRAETDGEYEAAASNVKKIRTNKSGDHPTTTTAGVGSSGYATSSNLGSEKSVSFKRKLYIGTNTLLLPPENGEVEEEISSVDEPAKLPKSKTSKRKSSTPKQIKRLKPGILALREIKKYRRSTELLIKKSPFSRVIREICQNMGRSDIRWAGTALEALQEAAEAYLVTMFEQSYLLTHHAKRVTLMASDIRLLNRLRS